MAAMAIALYLFIYLGFGPGEWGGDSGWAIPAIHYAFISALFDSLSPNINSIARCWAITITYRLFALMALIRPTKALSKITAIIIMSFELLAKQLFLDLTW